MARSPGVIDVEITSPVSLARFSLAARVDRSGSRSSTARRVGLTDSNFSKHLERLSSTSGPFVSLVDRVLASPQASPATSTLSKVIGRHPFLDQDDATPRSLETYTISLRAQWGDLFPADVPTLEVPGSMFAGLRRAGPPRNGSEVTVQAAALLALLNGFRSMTPSARLAELERLGDAIPTTIDALLTVASGPIGPTQAVALAARFGEHCLPQVWEHLTRSPLGYRMMRVILNLFRLVQTDGPGEPWDATLRRELLAALNTLLRDLRYRERPNPYPGRTLTVSAYLVCPQTPEFAWTTDALVDLAWFGGTMRERGHSALALAGRSSPHVPRIIDTFRTDPACDLGLGFLADWLELGKMPENSVAYRTVERVISAQRDHKRFDREDPDWLPSSVETAARKLMIIAALDVDALRRRRACEALNAGLVGPAATRVLTGLMQIKDPGLALVHQNCTLALSFLGQPDACATLLDVAADGFYDVETRATALWTVGDLASLTAPSRRLETIAAITRLLEIPQPIELQRSAAYALALVRSERDRLQEWRSSPDTLTAGLADWGYRRIRVAERTPSRTTMPDILVVSPLPTR